MNVSNAKIRRQRIIRILVTIDLVFYLGLYLLMRMQNFSDFRMLFMYPAFGYPLSVLIYIFMALHIGGIFLDREASAGDMVQGIVAALIFALLTPQVFLLWRSLLDDPGLIFQFISNRFLMTCLVMTRCLEPIYFILSRPYGLGKEIEK